MDKANRQLQEFKEYSSDFDDEIFLISDRLYKKFLYDGGTSVNWDDKIDTSDVGPFRSALRILQQGGICRLTQRAIDRITLDEDDWYFERKYANSIFNQQGVEMTNVEILVPYVPCREDYETLLYPVVNSLINRNHSITLYLPNDEKRKSEFNRDKFNTDSVIVGRDNLRPGDIREAQSRFESLKPKLMELNEYSEKLNTAKLMSFYKKFFLDEVVFEKVIQQTNPELIYSLHFMLNPGYVSAVNKTKCGNSPKVLLIQHGAGEWNDDYPFHDYLGADKVIAWGERTRKEVAQRYAVDRPPIKVLGSPKFQVKHEKHYKNIDMCQKDIDIFYPSTLQGDHTKQSHLMLFKLDFLNSLNVKYKPHPLAKEDFYRPAIDSGHVLKNEIVEDETVPELVCDSKIVVGTQSTALIEAIALNTPVIQLLPEMSKGNWNEKGLLGVSTTSELQSEISKLLSNPEYYQSILTQEREFVRDEIKNINGEDVISNIASYIESEIEQIIQHRERSFN